MLIRIRTPVLHEDGVCIAWILRCSHAPDAMYPSAVPARERAGRGLTSPRIYFCIRKREEREYRTSPPSFHSSSRWLWVIRVHERCSVWCVYRPDGVIFVGARPTSYVIVTTTVLQQWDSDDDGGPHAGSPFDQNSPTHGEEDESSSYEPIRPASC